MLRYKFSSKISKIFSLPITDMIGLLVQSVFRNKHSSTIYRPSVNAVAKNAYINIQESYQIRNFILSTQLIPSMDDNVIRIGNNDFFSTPHLFHDRFHL